MDVISQRYRNLLISGLSILIHDFISLPDMTSYDKLLNAN